MTGPEILRALVAKRREIETALNHHNLATSRLGHALEHVDATIRLFTDETAGKVLSALWGARRPLSADQLATHMGLAPRIAGQALRYLADCDLVRGERAHGQPTIWHPKY